MLKPSPETALDSYLLAEVAQEIGLPAGVLNIVTAGREISEHLVTHPGVDKISFTGSGAAGRHIAALCAQDLRRVTLELGGKSAAVVLEDADLDTSLGHIVSNGLMNNGQACIAQTRILAPQSRYDEVVDALAAKVGALKVGSALDADHRDRPAGRRAASATRVLGYIEKGKAAGRPRRHRWRTPGRPGPRLVRLADGLRRRRQPHDHRARRRSSARCCRSSRTTARTTRCGSPTTRRTACPARSTATTSGRRTDVARRLRTGTVAVNNMSPMDFAAPFGGFKQSGLGRELGPEGLQAYLEYKTITLPNDGPGGRRLTGRPR